MKILQFSLKCPKKWMSSKKRSEKRMKVLQICNKPPYPPNEGGSMAMHAEVRRGPGDVILLDEGTAAFYDSVSRVFYGKVGPNR